MNKHAILILILGMKLLTQSEVEAWGYHFNPHDPAPKGKKPKSLTLYPIRDNLYGRFYLRGFPKGALASHFPPQITENNAANKKWLDSIQNIPAFEEKKGIQYSFNEFYAKISSLLRSRTDGSPSCCDFAAQGERYVKPTPVQATTMDMFVDPTQSFQPAFLYRWCVQAWAKYNATIDKEAPFYKDMIAYCPNSCHGNPCKSTVGAREPWECTLTGPFEDSYECECEENRTWNPSTLQCQLANPCSAKEYPPCNPENTLKCIDKHDGTAYCICKDEFMGEDCGLPRDACQERIDKSKSNGNTNCQVNHGNECNPIIGTDYYTCLCVNGFEPLLTTSEDNCLGRRDPCHLTYVNSEPTETDTNSSATDSDEQNHKTRSGQYNHGLHRSGSHLYQLPMYQTIDCLNGGQCISSADFTHVTCLCKKSADGTPLYRGPNCETPIGKWSAWSSPTSCYPKNCGVTRYRWRRRRCLNVSTASMLVGAAKIPREKLTLIQVGYLPSLYCPGTSEEVLPCKPLSPCSVLNLRGYMREALLNYDTLYYFGMITAVMVFLSVLMWYVFAPPILICIRRRASQ
ncbi:unnamed protein product [Calicophoron daubneyi]|uniref:EGF-like domain-containing protein n=1 Tax=Calicophoron daubneyi TaxID=300641 RepID=A0AAV2TF07_CALDB